MIEKWRTVFKDSPARQSLAVLSSGFLLGIGFVFPLLYPVAFLGVALFVILITKTTFKSSIFFKGWGMGFIFYLLVLAGIASSLFPIDWVGIENPVFQWLIIISAWVITSLGMGISYGVLGWLIHKFKTNSWPDFLIVPVTWVVCEILAAWFFSLITIGQGTLWGGHFTIGFVGYLLANNLAILQVAALGGVYALSFLLVAMGVLIAKWLALPTQESKKRNDFALFSLIFLLLAIGPAYSIFLSQKKNETSIDTIKVAVISRYIPPSLDKDAEYWNQRHNELRELVAPLQNIDLLIFPENSAFLYGGSYGSEQTLALLHKLNRTDLLVIDSTDIKSADGSLRSVATFSSFTNTLTSEKQFLVPFGEYLPYIYILPMKLLGQGELLNKIQSLRGYRPGVKNANPEVAGVNVAVRFCDEVLSPLLYREQVKNGANLLVNMSSFSWFHGSPLVYKQMQNIAKVRAVENSRWYVQSGNMAPAFILDHHGRVIAESEWGRLSVLEAQVPSRHHRTLYNWIVN